MAALPELNFFVTLTKAELSAAEADSSAVRFFQGNVDLLTTARKLYRDVQVNPSSPGYLYKLSDRVTIDRDMDRVLNSFFDRLFRQIDKGINRRSGFQGVEAFVLSGDFIDESQPHQQILFSSLEGRIQELFQTVRGIQSNDEAMTVVQLTLKEMKSEVAALEEFKSPYRPRFARLFRTNERVEDLLRNGRIYAPGGMHHDLIVNLSWVLSHLVKGNIFELRADLFSNIFRGREGKQDKYSAFIIEICAALRMGRELFVEHGVVRLQPIRAFSGEQIISVQDLQPSEHMINQILNNLLCTICTKGLLSVDGLRTFQGLVKENIQAFDRFIDSASGELKALPDFIKLQQVLSTIAKLTEPPVRAGTPTDIQIILNVMRTLHSLYEIARNLGKNKCCSGVFNDQLQSLIEQLKIQEKVFTSRIDAGLKDFNGPIFQPSQARQMTGMYQEDRDTGDGGLSARATADPAASARAAAPTPQEVVAKPFTKLDQ